VGAPASIRRSPAVDAIPLGFVPLTFAPRSSVPAPRRRVIINARAGLHRDSSRRRRRSAWPSEGRCALISDRPKRQNWIIAVLATTVIVLLGAAGAGSGCRNALVRVFYAIGMTTGARWFAFAAI